LNKLIDAESFVACWYALVDSDFMMLRPVIFYSLDSTHSSPRLLDNSSRAGKHHITHIPA